MAVSSGTRANKNKPAPVQNAQQQQAKKAKKAVTIAEPSPAVGEKEKEEEEKQASAMLEKCAVQALAIAKDQGYFPDQEVVRSVVRAEMARNQAAAPAPSAPVASALGQPTVVGPMATAAAPAAAAAAGAGAGAILAPAGPLAGHLDLMEFMANENQDTSAAGARAQHRQVYVGALSLLKIARQCVLSDQKAEALAFLDWGMRRANLCVLAEVRHGRDLSLMQSAIRANLSRCRDPTFDPVAEVGASGESKGGKGGNSGGHGGAGGLRDGYRGDGYRGDGYRDEQRPRDDRNRGNGGDSGRRSNGRGNGRGSGYDR